MLQAICTTRVKKEILKKERKTRLRKYFLQGISNPDHQNQLELKVNASIYWTSSVNADSSSLKEVHILSLW